MKTAKNNKTKSNNLNVVPLVTAPIEEKETFTENDWSWSVSYKKGVFSIDAELLTPRDVTLFIKLLEHIKTLVTDKHPSAAELRKIKRQLG